MDTLYNPGRFEGCTNKNEQAPVPQTGSPKRPVILIAEDSETNAKLMLNMLGAIGFECDVAENGREAVDACIGKKYDLILMDCQMPYMDGYIAASKIRSIKDKNDNIIIIAVTAGSDEDEMEKCLSSGMNDCIFKPVTMKKIKEIINKYGYSLSQSIKEIEHEPGSFAFIVDNLMSETEISVGQAKELITEYIEDLPHQIDTLYKSISNSDFVYTGKLLHKMKGTAVNLRADHMLELLTGLEKGLPGIKRDILGSSIDRMKEYIELLNRQVDRI